MLLHYASAEATLPFGFGPRDAVGFPPKIASFALDTAHSLGLVTGRALDIGCAVGGATFALARECQSVLGIDLSATFMTAASTLRRDGRLSFVRRTEGENTEQVEIHVPGDIDRTRVTFRRADACALPVDLADFDVVLAANLICRLANPRAFLRRLSGPYGLLRPGGLLVLATPFTWDQRFTARANWLGGHSGQASFPVMQEQLAPAFHLLETRDMPFLIQEHARKFQYVVTLVSAWRRREE